MNKKKILLIDDERDLVETVAFRLETAGYEVISVYDGKDGLDRAKKENPDLIILDLMLPRIDGYKICGLLKADAKYSKIPIIMLKARAQDSDKEMGKEVGADAYIIKGTFDQSNLLNTVQNLVG